VPGVDCIVDKAHAPVGGGEPTLHSTGTRHSSSGEFDGGTPAAGHSVAVAQPLPRRRGALETKVDAEHRRTDDDGHRAT
jgi:hypothetical protein